MSTKPLNSRIKLALRLAIVDLDKNDMPAAQILVSSALKMFKENRVVDREGVVDPVKRVEGYYWVKHNHNEDYTVCRYTHLKGGGWLFAGNPTLYQDDIFEYIDTKPIKSPQKNFL